MTFDDCSQGGGSSGGARRGSEVEGVYNTYDQS